MPPINVCKRLFYPPSHASGECPWEQSFSPFGGEPHRSTEGDTKGNGGKKMKMTTGSSWFLFHALAELEGKHTPFLGRERLCISHLSALISQENQCRKTPDRPSPSPKNFRHEHYLPKL